MSQKLNYMKTSCRHLMAASITEKSLVSCVSLPTRSVFQMLGEKYSISRSGTSREAIILTRELGLQCPIRPVPVRFLASARSTGREAPRLATFSW